MGLTPTGRKGEITGINTDRYENGKLVENWTNWDNMQLMRDLGGLRRPPEPAPHPLQELTALAGGARRPFAADAVR